MNHMSAQYHALGSRANEVMDKLRAQARLPETAEFILYSDDPDVQFFQAAEEVLENPDISEDCPADALLLLGHMHIVALLEVGGAQNVAAAFAVSESMVWGM